MYLIDEDTADLATAYMTFEGEPREVDWQIYIDHGPDIGPGGKH